jgi:hypothetical protein
MKLRGFDDSAMLVACYEMASRGALRAGLTFLVALTSGRKDSIPVENVEVWQARRADAAHVDCGAVTSCVVLNGAWPPRRVGPLPNSPVPLCWNWNAYDCLPCGGDHPRFLASILAARCNTTYAECEGRCIAGA